MRNRLPHATLSAPIGTWSGLECHARELLSDLLTLVQVAIDIADDVGDWSDDLAKGRRHDLAYHGIPFPVLAAAPAWIVGHVAATLASEFGTQGAAEAHRWLNILGGMLFGQGEDHDSAEKQAAVAGRQGELLVAALQLAESPPAAWHDPEHHRDILTWCRGAVLYAERVAATVETLHEQGATPQVIGASVLRHQLAFRREWPEVGPWVGGDLRRQAVLDRPLAVGRTLWLAAGYGQGIASVSGADEDATSLTEWARDWADLAVCRINEDATVQELHALVTQALDGCRPGDQLLVYLSAHGGPPIGNNRHLQFAPPHTYEPDAMDAGGRWRGADALRLFRSRRDVHITVIVDACFAAAWCDDAELRPIEFERALPPHEGSGSLRILCAGARHEEAVQGQFDADGPPRSALTWALQQCLHRADLVPLRALLAQIRTVLTACPLEQKPPAPLLFSDPIEAAERPLFW